MYARLLSSQVRSRPIPAKVQGCSISHCSNAAGAIVGGGLLVPLQEVVVAGDNPNRIMFSCQRHQVVIVGIASHDADP